MSPTLFIQKKEKERRKREEKKVTTCEPIFQIDYVANCQTFPAMDIG